MKTKRGQTTSPDERMLPGLGRLAPAEVYLSGDFNRLRARRRAF
ncbi:MAG: hypothetical protein AAF385_01080 [Pseudomonadota bacterium]